MSDIILKKILLALSTYQTDSYPLDKAITLRGSPTWVQTDPCTGQGAVLLYPKGTVFCTSSGENQNPGADIFTFTMAASVADTSFHS